ncbi:MAG: TetR/AcrR family transcriptional regulator [Firmicutes bacterium]|nr:TetR/AcrR family transcriptional regulator [Bacillota bacterium]
MSVEQRRPGRPRASDLSIPTAERILRVAASSFLQLGYDGVSLESVAKECQVTKATVYYYFSSKAHLFTSAMLQMMEDARIATKRILEMPLPLYDRLRKVAIGHLRISAPMDFEAVLQRGMADLTEEQRRAMQAAEHRLQETLAAAFAEATARGEARPIDPALAARSFTAALLKGKTDEERLGQVPFQVEKRAEEILALFWFGFGGSDERVTPSGP